jgi:hypothetical protein
VDNVEVDDHCENYCVNYWLHSWKIAVLSRYNNNIYGLVLDNQGYSTRITIDVLNDILRYLKDKLGVDHGVSFHLKYEKLGRPIATYIRFGERTYLTGRVELFFKPGVARPVIVVLDTSTKIYFFKDHPELRGLYKLYRELSKLDDEVKELYDEYRRKISPEIHEIVRDMFRKMYGEDFSDNEYGRIGEVYYILTDDWGFKYFGVFAKYIDDGYAEFVRNFIKGEIVYAKYVVDKLRRLFTIAELIR